jgi:hypothetical protein
MAMMATTIISSMRVKPPCMFFFMKLFLGWIGWMELLGTLSPPVSPD